MALHYNRNQVGQFASKPRGDSASTVLAERRKHQQELRSQKKALSGGAKKSKKGKPVSRNKSAGKRATTKAIQNAMDRARSRFR